jgi:CheY-like chemotaxis protein
MTFSELIISVPSIKELITMMRQAGNLNHTQPGSFEPALSWAPPYPRNWGLRSAPETGVYRRLCSGVSKFVRSCQDRIVTGSRIRVLAVDHHVILREGLALLIQSQADMELVGAVPSAKEAVASFAQNRPAVTLMDLDLPGAAAIAAIDEIRKLEPAACILGLVTCDWDGLCNQAIHAGARKCLTKDRLDTELPAAIRDCAS